MEKKYTEINILSIEEIKKIMEFPGKVKGAAFKGQIEYILKKKGEKGLRKVEKEIERLGLSYRI